MKTILIMIAFWLLTGCNSATDTNTPESATTPPHPSTQSQELQPPVSPSIE